MLIIIQSMQTFTKAHQSGKVYIYERLAWW